MGFPEGNSIEVQIKHLEFTQSIIARLSNCSFLIKGWALTISTGIFAFAITALDWRISILALVPQLLFWGLDAHFLKLERAYRRLYDGIRRGNAEGGILSLDARPHYKDVGRLRLLISGTLSAFYGSLMLVDLILLLMVIWKV
jgi:hypothetical protein